MPYKNKPIFWNGRYRLYKESTIFCFPTIYSIWSRFFESWYDIGWLQNRQSLCFGHFFLVLPKSGVLNPNSDYFFRLWFLALKPCLAFFSKKRSPQMNIFGFCVSHWLNIWVHFPILIFLCVWFWIIYDCLMFWNVDLSW